MGLSCGGRCLQIILASFNLIFFIGGLVLLGIGVWAANDKGILQRMESVQGEHMGKIHALASNGVPKAVAAFGGLLVIVSFMGCCGALKQWRPLLIGYIIALLIIFIGIIASTTAIAVFSGPLKTAIGNEFREAIKESYGPDNDFTNKFDQMMEVVGCCGVSAKKKDFVDSKWKKDHERSDFPHLCCPGLPKGQNCSSKSDTFITTGCVDKFFATLEKHKSNIVNVVGIFGTLILAGSFFACYLTHDISRNQM